MPTLGVVERERRMRIAVEAYERYGSYAVAAAKIGMSYAQTRKWIKRSRGGTAKGFEIDYGLAKALRILAGMNAPKIYLVALTAELYDEATRNIWTEKINDG